MEYEGRKLSGGGTELARVGWRAAGPTLTSGRTTSDHVAQDEPVSQQSERQTQTSRRCVCWGGYIPKCWYVLTMAEDFGIVHRKFINLMNIQY